MYDSAKGGSKFLHDSSGGYRASSSSFGIEDMEVRGQDSGGLESMKSIPRILLS
eukprot:CAMPEP_0116863100 /NCGR_PEP_ID=MMETSP0418-20121206/24019_1 /TAXON_ID=1158023 /ORGANISM="Astrosyne radiata, Strain 13vi08-1A" /LENGTH=53 /DNA_ID=CAMNT_0004498053 /DNA_START=138 /DNA_END=296 /DNA_ORIENTATION=-